MAYLTKPARNLEIGRMKIVVVETSKNGEKVVYEVRAPNAKIRNHNIYTLLILIN